jgi:hypothetical protein
LDFIEQLYLIQIKSDLAQYRPELGTAKPQLVSLLFLRLTWDVIIPAKDNAGFK